MASTAVMNSNSAVDLALLGLLAEGSRSGRGLVGAIKMMGGDGFTPTSAFIEGRIADLIEGGHLEPREGGDGWCVTPAGTAHLNRLLRLEIDPGAATLRGFCTTLKLSLLNRLGIECRRAVIADLMGAGRRRADQLEAARQDRGGPMMERCLALERARAGFEQRWMQDVAAAEGAGEIVV